MRSELEKIYDKLERAKRETDYFRRQYAEEAVAEAEKHPTLYKSEKARIAREAKTLMRKGWTEQATSALAELRAWRREFGWNPNHLNRDWHLEQIEGARDKGDISLEELGTTSDEIAAWWRLHHIQDIGRTLNNVRTWTPEKGCHWLSRNELLGLVDRELEETKLSPEDIGSSAGELQTLRKLGELEDIIHMLEFVLGPRYLEFNARAPGIDRLQERAEDVAVYRKQLHAIADVPDTVPTGKELLGFAQSTLDAKIATYKTCYAAELQAALREETEKEEYIESLDRRLDQDINFVVGAVKCRIQLDTTAPGHDDYWIIKPKGIADPSASRAAKHFPSRISDALEALGKGNTRQQYDWQVNDDYALMVIRGDEDEWSLTSGIEASFPDWDGNSMDFRGNYRLSRLLADWKEAIPGIVFTRGNGSEIVFSEKHLRVSYPQDEIDQLHIAAGVYEEFSQMPEIAIPGIAAQRRRKAKLN